MPTPPTPEEVLGRPDGPPLVLSLSCTKCGTVSKKERFEWACVNPNLEACRADGWDGVSLSRIFTCAKCGTADAYKLDTKSVLAITAEVFAITAAQPRGRIVLGDSRLWDGTQVRRPSQALAHLRALAAKHDSAEAHIRLGNGCERYGLLEEAVASWRRAVELAPNSLDALGSLANQLLNSKATAKEGLGFLRRRERDSHAALDGRTDQARLRPRHLRHRAGACERRPAGRPHGSVA